MLAGNAVQFALSPLDSMRTLTAHIGLVLSSDIGGGEHQSLLLAGGIAADRQRGGQSSGAPLLHKTR
ncbi:MAG: hypothetical protein LBR71_03840, partial [Synergistaceae bacterium]|jgi:ABC-type phosphate transport system permease subunit|nr:hypothetical protein [Synergistaceae bacterium]